MSMADDNRLRAKRSSEAARRGGHPADERPSGDPLAELARLIGQSDPFADYERRDARDPAPRDPPPKAAPTSDWRRAAAAMPPYDSPPEPSMRAPSRAEPRFADSPSPGHDPYRMAAEQLDQGYEDRPSQYRQEPQFADDAYHPRADERTYQDERTYGGRDQRSQPAYFDDGAPLGARDEDDYDDPPRARRRGGLLTAVTLIGCAMIGTAGAYGYRTYYVTPNASRVPPVISAESAPTKVVSATEGPTGKFIQDRVRDPIPNERLVPREEEPLEIRTPTSPPRVVLPAPVSPSQSGFPPPSSGSTAGGNGVNAYAPPAGNGATGETKRVRTVTIRPDGADPAPARPPSGNPPAGAAPPRPAPPAAKAAPRNTGPISLDPQETPPPAPRERVAAAPPPATTQSVQPPAPRLSSVPADGAITVQLSSQRSEAEAQASYRALQAKFPDQLSGRSVMVKRVDLGSKGVYYRALVGPFASNDEAAQLCADLKAAGGQCLIQRN